MTSPNEDKIALARRAVACKGWRWMAGMLGMWSPSWRTLGGIKKIWQRVRYEGRAAPWLEVGIPDLDDPATLGCLLALVREAWGNDTISVQADGRRWVVRGDEFVLFTLNGEPSFDSEAHALVAALEAAP